jgi:hypothetical protein
MGVVYLAEHPRLPRRDTLKVLLPEVPGLCLRGRSAHWDHPALPDEVVDYPGDLVMVVVVHQPDDAPRSEPHESRDPAASVSSMPLPNGATFAGFTIVCLLGPGTGGQYLAHRLRRPAGIGGRGAPWSGGWCGQNL